MGSCVQPSQASQLGVYKAFVDNYKEAVETAEKCSHANLQFQNISEVSPKQLLTPVTPVWEEQSAIKITKM